MTIGKAGTMRVAAAVLVFGGLFGSAFGSSFGVGAFSGSGGAGSSK